MKTSGNNPRKPEHPARGLPPKLLSINQTCDVLGIGRTSLYGLIARKRLNSLKLGRRTLISSDVLDAFVASLSAPAPDHNVTE